MTLDCDLKPDFNLLAKNLAENTVSLLSDIIERHDSAVLKGVYEQITVRDKEIERLKTILDDMHIQVGGYFKGEDWEHWQEFHKARFES